MNYQDYCLPPSNYRIIRWFKFDQLSPEQAFTSHWISSRAFFFVRLGVTLYSTVVFWAYFVLMIKLDRFEGFFKAFTTMTFAGLHAYLVTSSIYHYRYLRSKSIDDILQQHPCLNYMYLYLYSTVITFNVLTPLVFWSMLSQMQSNVDPVVAWINISVHGTSFFLMFIDVILNRIVIPIRLVLLVFVTMVSYLLFAIIIYACKHEWLYPFLSWDQGPFAAVWYMLLIALVVGIFFFMVCVHFARDWVAYKTGRFARIGQDSPKSDKQHSSFV